MKYVLLCLILVVTCGLYGVEHECAFCRQKVIDSQLVYENGVLRVLLDYAPRVKGHLLVVPKRHVVMAHELSSEEWKALSDAISKAAKVFQKHFGSDQYVLLEKNGPHAFQTVPHVHFHLLPIPKELTTETFLKIYADSPHKLTPSELKDQVERFRRSFTVSCPE